MFETRSLTGEIDLIYFANQSVMPAKFMGEAIIGLDTCLRECAKVGKLNYDAIYIEPLEIGSIKTTLKYIRKHPFEVIVGLGVVAGLLNDSFQIIDRYGASNLRNPTVEVLHEIKDARVLDLCTNFDFRKGLNKIAEPLDELNQKAHIVIGEKTMEINCENKYKFYIDKETEEILPELVNGSTVTLFGEITRINKKANDLGFSYKGYSMNVSPLEKEKSTKEFHEYLELDEVKLQGVVFRDNNYQVPRLKVISITPATSQQLSTLQ